MGASQSADTAPDSLTILFDPSELEALTRAFSKLVDPKTRALIGLSAGLVPTFPWAALYRSMKELVQPPGGPVKFEHFLGAIAAVCKGRRSERIASVAALYAVGPTEKLLSVSSLKNLLGDAAVAARSGDPSAPLADEVLAALAADVLLGGGGVATPEQWASWVGSQLPALPQAHEIWLLQYLCAFGRSPAPSATVTAAATAATSGASPLPYMPPPLAAGVLDAVQEPLLVPAEGQAEGHELLEPTSAWLISLAIGAARPGAGTGAQAPSWRCLYASRTMGLSMNRFTHHASGYAGPTLLVCLTEQGEVFGAYVDVALKASEKYIGGSNCFLFTLLPHFHVYRPTTISKNYVLYNPPQTGVLATESYLKGKTASAPEVIGFGGQTARLRLSLEEDLNVLRWHHSCTTYSKHDHAAASLPEGPRKVRALELWGCGGADADAVMKALRERRTRDAQRAGKVDRVAMFGGGGGDWRGEDNVDKMILETAGAHTFYSHTLEKLPDGERG